MTRGTVAAVLPRILAICLVLTQAPACYSPAQPDCGFVCGTGGACPDGYTCASDGICHRDGTPASLVCAVDARPDSPQPIDAPPPDADTTAPTVFETQPANGATDVPVTTTIAVQFTEAVINVSASTFVVQSTATMIPGTIATVDPQTYTFTPTAALPASATIDVRLTSGITDVAGNPLAAGTMFSFTTGM